MSETFLFHRKGRWFWVNLLAVIFFSLVYLADNPVGGRNGDTTLGYTLGTISFLGILYLLWYGVRKRSYHANGNTLKGCLSAHAWLGISLAILVPLHAGFNFGLDIHTLAYILMMIVVLSGIYGAFEYVRSAPLIAAHRGGGHAAALLDSIERVSKEIAAISVDRSDAFHRFIQKIDFSVRPSVWGCARGEIVPEIDQSELSTQLGLVSQPEADDALKVIGLIKRKRELALRLQNDLRILLKLRLWLFVHVPISLALFVCVIAHIIIVFLYW